MAHRTVDFDKAGKQTNNHHYWRGLAAVATGVISSDDDLFNWGIGVYKQAIGELDERGGRTAHARSRRCRFKLPIIVGVANVVKANPREGSNRSTA